MGCDDVEMPIDLEQGPANPVRVERTGAGTFAGHNPRGAHVQISASGVPGEYFTPGELLKVALAACSAVTAEAPLARALGDDFELEVRAAGESVDSRYPALAEQLIVDLAGLDDATRRRVLTVVARAIGGYCTVGRTIESGATVSLEIQAEV